MHSDQLCNLTAWIFETLCSRMNGPKVFVPHTQVSMFSCMCSGWEFGSINFHCVRSSWKWIVKIQSQISFNASQKTSICSFESSCLIWTDNQPNRASAALHKSCHSCILVHWGNVILRSGCNPPFSHVFLHGMSWFKASLGPIVAVVIAVWIVS